MDSGMIRAFILVSCFIPIQAQPYWATEPVCLNEDDVKWSFLGDPCSNEGDCYNHPYEPGATECLRGQCACKNGYMPSNFNTTNGDSLLLCMRAPGLNEACTTMCQKPYQCVETASADLGYASESDPGVATDSEELGSRRAYVMSTPSSQKTCQCQSPYIDQYTAGCYLECKDGEIYKQEFGECKKRCLANEIMLPDGSCLKMANLGESCEDKNQCTAAFSKCEKGKCICDDGFKTNGEKGICETATRTCPFGQPTVQNGSVFECKIIQTTNENALIKPPYYARDDISDTCLDDQFCMVGGNGLNILEGSNGHCCPIPKPACPIGQAHPNASCQYSPMSFRNPNAAGGHQSCPTNTHECIHVSYGYNLEFDLCCPLACAFGQLMINGRCYPLREYGDQCDLDSQCGGHSGACISGKCACGPGYDVQGITTFKFCQRKTCENGKTLLWTGLCGYRLNVGDQCDPNAPDFCPANSMCSSKSRKCICNCGSVKLNDTLCGPEPKCYNPYANSSVALVKGTPTFCVVPGDDQPLISEAVQECPAGQYCNVYMDNLGLCCQIPEKQFCPDGSIGRQESCDWDQNTSCGDGKWCHRYMMPADPNDRSIGYICCTF